MLQSNYLLNIKLEADNCTLIWSKPSWDLVNHWEINNINGNANNIGNSAHNLSNHNLLSVNKANNIRKSIVASLESSVKPESYFRKKAASTPPLKFRNSTIDLKYPSIATTQKQSEELNHKYSMNSLTKHYVQRDYVNIDSYEGFLDLHLVKHLRLGCVDSQIYCNLQQIARKYNIFNFDQTNIISVVYGNIFSENR